jgi:hypothetical protein
MVRVLFANGGEVRIITGKKIPGAGSFSVPLPLDGQRFNALQSYAMMTS